jgi:small GTP-binding protein
MLQKKVCMLGPSAVGKTSLVRRFVHSVYSDSYHTTIGVKIDKKVLAVTRMKEITLVLWDIYGHDEFQQVRISYLRGAGGYLLVADGTRPDTINEALELEGQVNAVLGKVPSVVVVNKSDLSYAWKLDAGRLAALEDSSRIVVRTSAKTGEGVETAFHELVCLMLKT